MAKSRQEFLEEEITALQSAIIDATADLTISQNTGHGSFSKTNQQIDKLHARLNELYLEQELLTGERQEIVSLTTNYNGVRDNGDFN